MIAVKLQCYDSLGASSAPSSEELQPRSMDPDPGQAGVTGALQSTPEECCQQEMPQLAKCQSIPCIAQRPALSLFGRTLTNNKYFTEVDRLPLSVPASILWPVGTPETVIAM